MKSIPTVKQTVIIFLSLLFVAGCYRAAISSTWAEPAVVIDGDDSDWERRQVVGEYDQAVVGFMNDDAYLYISLRTGSQAAIRQVMVRGLIVWIDSKGGQKKRFGIRYPIGSELLGMASMAADRRRHALDDSSQFEAIINAQPGIEIIGPGKGDVALLSLVNKASLQVGISLSRDQLVYELKVPLRKAPEQEYAINARPGGKIGVGIEAGGLDLRSRQGPGGFAEGGIGRPGLPTGMVPGGRPGGGMGRQMPAPLKIWTQVTLSERE